MKLIRQNDEAGGLVLTQNLAGKARKQNYNFGKAFKGQSSSTLYIAIPSLVGYNQTDFSILFFEKLSTNTTPVGSLGFFVDTQNGVRFGPSGTRGLYGIDIRKNNTNISLLTKTTSIGSQVYASYSQDVNGAIFSINGQQGSNVNYIDGVVSIFSIAREFLNNRVSDSKFSVFCFYNRKLTQDDMQYLYNNGLGNEPLSVLGLLNYYIFQQADILDFSENNYVYDDYDPLDVPIDSDFKVGIRNYGSILNGHGKILGLPIGSLEEQRNYANANLFEVW